ncbi:MAG: DUF362 domain-containing protein [Candidatus Latescibacteria bacterium]|jgi:uncharacterized protein|nr:DUF362 domain-containing protein [Candidatus Latescibacterota bacterium]
MKNETLLFADAAVESLEINKTLPAKFKRMLKKKKLQEKVADKNVAIKMHLGGGIGYTTISPVFVRILVQSVKDAGAKSVFIIDGKNPEEGIPRGYTSEVLGCQLLSCFGHSGNYYRPEPIGYKSLDEALLSGEAMDCDFFIDLSHVKGHGTCGFGGALKNIAMGVIPPETRSKIHHLEGGLTIDRDKCVYCLKCFKSCPNEAIWKDDEKKEITFFFHNCTYCQHCVMVCPEKAITMEDRKFEEFSRGMALVTSAFLKKFKPQDLLFINFLTNITIYCDCWEFSTPSLVPDIGILMGDDIAAIDTASLDMIKTEDLLPKGLPKGRKLLDVDGHLFEKIHGKDPYLMINYLSKYYDCNPEYKILEMK